MRRLVRIPTKSSAAIAVLCIGAIYGAAEARQTMLRGPQCTPVFRVLGRSREGEELARIERVAPAPAAQPATTSLASDLSGAEKGAASPIPAVPKQSEKPALAHTRKIIISIPHRRLALIEDGKVVKTYPIAVGARGTPSPDGDFVIINRAKDPTYRHKGTVIDPGDDNPLGSRWMGLSVKGYGIHGTNVPKSIGKAASHGCFRMARKDVEDLYERVHVGDSVSVHREKDELITSVFPADAGAADAGSSPMAIAESQTTSTANSSDGAAAQH